MLTCSVATLLHFSSFCFFSSFSWLFISTENNFQLFSSQTYNANINFFWFRGNRDLDLGSWVNWLKILFIYFLRQKQQQQSAEPGEREVLTFAVRPN